MLSPEHLPGSIKGGAAWSLRGFGGRGDEDLPDDLGREVDRRALFPRLLVLAVLGVGALLEYGHGHRAGHWIVLAVYGLTTAALALASRSAASRSWLPWAATAADAGLAVYVIADHLPRDAHDVFLASDAVSLFPAFLLLLQTGLRLRRDLVALFAGIVAGGWLLALVLYAGSDTAAVPLGGTPFTARQALGFISFASSAGFVLYAVHWMRRAWAATLRARAHQMMLSRFLPEGVAADVIDGEGAVDIVERHVCLLSVDIRGFSTLTRTRPSREVIGVLMEFRRLVHEAVSRHGGIVDKYLGDGVLAVFLNGTPERQAADAFNAAKDVLHRVGSWRAPTKATEGLRVIATLHRGLVLAGVFDDGRRAEFTVLGPAMNALSRMERRSKEADLDLVASKRFLRLLPTAILAQLDARLVERRAADDELPDVFAITP